MTDNDKRQRVLRSDDKRLRRTPIADRFWAKVDKQGADDCWMWTGAKQSGGYGTIWEDSKLRRATWVSWELSTGQLWPDGMDACHHCDTPSCVNPAHIFPGSVSENMQDASRKGRTNTIGRGLRTECKYGHPYTLENTYLRPSTNHRECRTCRKASQSTGAHRGL